MTVPEARKLIGENIKYRHIRDYDTSGRGYVSDYRYGTVLEVVKKNINISGTWEWLSNLRDIEKV